MRLEKMGGGGHLKGPETFLPPRYITNDFSIGNVLLDFLTSNHHPNYLGKTKQHWHWHLHIKNTDIVTSSIPSQGRLLLFFPQRVLFYSGKKEPYTFIPDVRWMVKHEKASKHIPQMNTLSLLKWRKCTGLFTTMLTFSSACFYLCVLSYTDWEMTIIVIWGENVDALPRMI